MAEFSGFSPNPGQLRMLVHGDAVASGRPLVILLHGCGQDAATFAAGSGWCALADRLGFGLVVPEQAEANNQGRCFHWFQTDDTQRDQGEAGSIAAMTRTAVAHFRSARDQVFIAGLSAGGAMAAALLAAYPELYAAGAVVAGLPVGSASSAYQALVRMSDPTLSDPADTWAERAARRGPSGYRGPWPRLSVWHGAADTVVAPENGALLAGQWRALHGLPAAPSFHDMVDGARRVGWGDPACPAVEHWTLPDRAHDYPIGHGLGRPGLHIRDGAISATLQIARFWRLA